MLSILIAASVPSASFQVPLSFVAVTFTGFVSPSGVYVTSTFVVLLSFAGVILTSPLSSAFTVGACGFSAAGTVAFDVAVAVDLLPDPSLASALTSVPGLTLSFGSVITPVDASTVASEPAGTVQVPLSFVAVTVFVVPSLSL